VKKPIIAFTLSFLLPGAGLAYLGKWKWGFINLGVVLLIGVVAAFTLSNETMRDYGHYIAIVCSGGSAGLASTLTKQMNQKVENHDVAKPGAGAKG
jgi:hypothetical protein